MELIGRISERTTIKLDCDLPFKQGCSERNTGLKEIEYYREGNKIKCIIRVGVSLIGIGVAICHEEDNFDLERGCALAELRARADFYKDCANTYKKSL